ncbi:carboxymuconolactone decarboxylase family protein [soil metagenome]
MTIHRPSHDVLDALWPQHRELRQRIPEVYQGLDELNDAAMVDAALSVKHKKLIALAIAVAQGCEGSIAAKARDVVRAGATSAEVAEAIGVAVTMAGEPATVHGARAFGAFQEFDAVATQIRPVSQRPQESMSPR